MGFQGSPLHVAKLSLYTPGKMTLPAPACFLFKGRTQQPSECADFSWAVSSSCTFFLPLWWPG